MKKSERMTEKNTAVRIVDRFTAVVFNKWQEHVVELQQSGFGPHARADQLQKIVESGHADWSEETIRKVARMIEEKAILSGV